MLTKRTGHLQTREELIWNVKNCKNASHDGHSFHGSVHSITVRDNIIMLSLTLSTKTTRFLVTGIS